jgi:hypothetical protein
VPDDDRLLEGFINPLAFFEVDEPWANVQKQPVTAENVLRYLCDPAASSDVDSIVKRYREISVEADNRLFVVPADQGFLQKLIWPLRHAKSAYALGDYLGTIALCGTVAEMLAILTFEMSDAYMSKSGQTQPLSPEYQKLLFGMEFERLGQERRIRVLLALGLIDQDVMRDFDTVRVARRRYLHLFSQEHTTIAADAVTVFLATVGLVRATLGLGIKDGKVVLRPQVIRYFDGRSPSPDAQQDRGAEGPDDAGTLPPGE